jgi:hypothetical protein
MLHLPFRLLTAFVGLAVSAFAQIDGAKFASDLRTKFGPPLARETFKVGTGSKSPGDKGWESGVEMIVDYSANGQVCGIQLPPYGSGKPGATLADELISDLIPLALRGKETGRGTISLGSLSMHLIEYENLILSETWVGGARTRMDVILINEGCKLQPIH